MSNSSPPRIPIRTQHCCFCNHLLIATTRNLSHLPHRSGAAVDQALILPLDQDGAETHPDDTQTDPHSQTERKQQQQQQGQKHTTLLLSTTLPDRRSTLIRRDDGIEKRLFLRCGRCRVVVGYYLDRVHYPASTNTNPDPESVKPPAVYILPAALVETEDMGEGEAQGEWMQWIKP